MQEDRLQKMHLFHQCTKMSVIAIHHPMTQIKRIKWLVHLLAERKQASTQGIWKQRRKVWWSCNIDSKLNILSEALVTKSLEKSIRKRLAFKKNKTLKCRRIINLESYMLRIIGNHLVQINKRIVIPIVIRKIKTYLILFLEKIYRRKLISSFSPTINSSTSTNTWISRNYIDLITNFKFLKVRPYFNKHLNKIIIHNMHGKICMS